jgi:hypothetical protein
LAIISSCTVSVLVWWISIKETRVPWKTSTFSLLASILAYIFNVENAIIRGCKWNETVTKNVTVTKTVALCDYWYIRYQVTEVLVLTSLPWK